MAFTSSRVLVATMLLGMLSSASYAYSPEQEQLCTGDAMRLCSTEIPNVDRVTACMVRQRSQLSEGCKSVFAPAPTASAAAPVSYRPTPVKTSKPINLVPAKAKKHGA